MPDRQKHLQKALRALDKADRHLSAAYHATSPLYPRKAERAVAALGHLVLARRALLDKDTP